MQTAIKQQTIQIDDIIFTEDDVRDLIKGLSDSIQEIEKLKSACWSKKAMRCGCWETKD